MINTRTKKGGISLVSEDCDFNTVNSKRVSHLQFLILHFNLKIQSEYYL